MINLLLSILSGILLGLAFPKADFYPLAWIALIPLLFAIYRSESRRESAFLGFSCGLFFFGITLFWIMTLSEYVGFWGYAAWLGLIIYQSLFILLFCFILKLINFSKYEILIVPILWVTFEWLRSLGPYGVTAGDLGYSQCSLLPLIQIASFTSVYGISFLIVLVNTALAQILIKRGRREWGLAAFVLATLILVYIYGQRELQASSPLTFLSPVKLAIIQPNIDQKTKLNYGKSNEIFNIHFEMSEEALKSKPDIIIWPESSVLFYLLHDKHFEEIKKLAVSEKIWFLIGTPHYEYIDGRKFIFNSVVAISPTGEVRGRYDKKHLVPFGEYLPLRPIFYPLLKDNLGLFEEDFNSNPDTKILEVKNLKVGTMICFESTFPYVVKDRVRRGAEILLVITNDAWFKDSAAAYQHLNAGIFRAVESRKYLIQAANTGISAIIDPYGKILYRSKLKARVIILGEIKP